MGGGGGEVIDESHLGLSASKVFRIHASCLCLSLIDQKGKGRPAYPGSVTALCGSWSPRRRGLDLDRVWTG